MVKKIEPYALVECVRCSVWIFSIHSTTVRPMNAPAWAMVSRRPHRSRRTLPWRIPLSARWAGTLDRTRIGVMNEIRNSLGLSSGGGGHVSPAWNRRKMYERNRMKKNVASVKISMSIPQNAGDLPSSAPWG
jgi:hypothetical protein